MPDLMITLSDISQVDFRNTDAIVSYVSQITTTANDFGIFLMNVPNSSEPTNSALQTKHGSAKSTQLSLYALDEAFGAMISSILSVIVIQLK